MIQYENRGNEGTSIFRLKHMLVQTLKILWSNFYQLFCNADETKIVYDSQSLYTNDAAIVIGSEINCHWTAWANMYECILE